MPVSDAPRVDGSVHVRRVVQVMGTVFSVDVVDATGLADRALDDIEAWWHWVDVTFSTYRDDSVISRMARGELSVAKAPPEVGEVLGLCADMQRRTGGFFSAIANGAVDPTGLVKGWSVEVASERLHAAGFPDHCLNGGGDVQARGRPEAERLWSVAVAHPLSRGELLAVVTGEDIAVATSGVSERGAHITDPFTGRPATALAAVTVVGADVTTADGYATAAMAMGAGARHWLERVDEAEGYRSTVVDRDGVVWHSPGWKWPASGVPAQQR